MSNNNNILDKRRAGVLLHITSLPNTTGKGDLGSEAYHFINFLKEAGLSVWQMLPLGMPHNDGSPYQCLSAHAGNPALISLECLQERGWLDEINGSKIDCLKTAYQNFSDRADDEQRTNFELFCAIKADWLNDFSLFLALRQEFSQSAWVDWPEAYKERNSSEIQEAKHTLVDAINQAKFEQYIFFQQWYALKEYANKKGILLFGDIPIFVSYDSADVWAHREVFKLNEQGEMTVVAGVPPDYFSETGQRWGNPHYNWAALEANGFVWWLKRIESQFELFDIVRIDHFRGFEAAWEINADEDTAINGEWVTAPGEALLAKVKEVLGDIALVAEDLGVITPEVEALRDNFQLPGMKILQFAFGDDGSNPYLPHNYSTNNVVYTGTHDNDTTLGWYNSLSDGEKSHIYEVIDHSKLAMPDALIFVALASVANLAIIPMQDILELGSEDRMNIPGTTEGNWQWQFSWQQLAENKAGQFAHWMHLLGRVA